jgi:hypothetical protein
MHDISNRSTNRFGRPKVSSASVPSPAALAGNVDATLIQRPTGVSFHRDHHQFRFRVSGNHNVDVIGSNMRRE